MYHNQIVHHKLCFNLSILHNNLFDNQGGEKNKNDIFCTFLHTVFYENFLPNILYSVSPRPLNSVQTLLPTECSGHEFNSHSVPTLHSHSNFIICSVLRFISAYAITSNIYQLYQLPSLRFNLCPTVY